jgi:hypothetical protein
VRSPWDRALGGSAGELAPALRTYFGTIPDGHVGRGSGMFTAVGTPRRWLWPLLGVLALDGIVFPAWARDVPFSVENRPTATGTVRATRTFHFAHGDRVMVDEVGVTASGLVDRLGRRGIVSAALSAGVVDGHLELRSTGVTLRLGLVRVPLGVLSPRVTLIERTEGDHQHVSLRLDAPLVGRLYEYAGSFRYQVERDARD